MKILKPGNIKTCKCCGCVFKYKSSDIRTGYKKYMISQFLLIYEYWEIRYIVCPQCGEHIELNRHRLRK